MARPIHAIRRICGRTTVVAAGVTGAVLVVAGVWGLHVLTPGGGVTGSVGWVLLLLAGVRRVG